MRKFLVAVCKTFQQEVNYIVEAKNAHEAEDKVNEVQILPLWVGDPDLESEEVIDVTEVD